MGACTNELNATQMPWLRSEKKQVWLPKGHKYVCFFLQIIHLRFVSTPLYLRLCRHIYRSEVVKVGDGGQSRNLVQDRRTTASFPVALTPKYLCCLATMTGTYSGACTSTTRRTKQNKEKPQENANLSRRSRRIGRAWPVSKSTPKVRASYPGSRCARLPVACGISRMVRPSVGCTR